VHGRPSAILHAPQDLEQLEGTIAVLADNESLRDPAAFDDDIAVGRVGSACGHALVAHVNQAEPLGSEITARESSTRGATP
jgi:hypothetical protein